MHGLRLHPNHNNLCTSCETGRKVSEITYISRLPSGENESGVVGGDRGGMSGNFRGFSENRGGLRGTST